MTQEQINELRKLAQAAIIAGENGIYSEFVNAKTAFGQVANPAAILALIQQRDELLAALKKAHQWFADGDDDRRADELHETITKAEAQS